MLAFILTYIAQFLTLDALRVLQLTSRGSSFVAVVEITRRFLGDSSHTYAQLVHPAKAMSTTRFQALASAMLCHQHEILNNCGESTVLGIPGMSWGEAMVFERVSVEFPIAFCGLQVAWRFRHESHSNDHVRGCAVGLGHATVRESSKAFDVASILVYLRCQTGTYHVVVTVLSRPEDGRPAELYWALRLAEQTVTIAPLPDDAISSHPMFLGRLAAVSNPAARQQALQTKLVPTKFLINPHHQSVVFSWQQSVEPTQAYDRNVSWFDARDKLVQLYTVPKCAAATSLLQDIAEHVDGHYLAHVTRSVESLPQLFSHEVQYQSLITPKGVWQCETGMSSVTPADATSAWQHAADRIRRHLVRAWPLGLSALWTDGLVPIGMLLMLGTE